MLKTLHEILSLHIEKPATVDEKLFKKQLQLEEEGVETSITKYNNEIQKAYENNGVSHLPIGVKILHSCIHPFSQALTEKLQDKRGMTKVKIINFVKEFNLDVNTLSFLTSKIIVNYSSRYSPVVKVVSALKRVLVDEINYKYYEKESEGLTHTIIEDNKVLSKKDIMKLLKRGFNKKNINPVNIDTEVLNHVCLFLIYTFVSSTGLVNIENVRESKTKTIRRLSSNGRLLELLDKSKSNTELLEPEYLPMLIPPRDWVSPNDGAFYSLKKNFTYHCKLVRHSLEERSKILENTKMPKFYKAVNSVQKTAWQINRAVLEIAQRVWENNITVGDVLPHREIEIPVKPFKDDFENKEEWEEFKKNNYELVCDYYNKLDIATKDKIRYETKRVAVAKKLYIANRFKKEKEIYFCWNADFRGRLYPLQTHLNPQGDDLAKALLMFANGKKVGERGMYWLKIHGANTWGYDKVSFSKRVEWVDENKQMIADIAIDPDSNTQWQEADKPFSFLAFCFQFMALEDDPNDEVYLPIAMDGTCNGLQHFSALLRDPIGAKATNVILGDEDKPSDIYLEVLEATKDSLRKDRDIPLKIKSIIFNVVLDRKVIKKPVMTLPYGVTYVGMKDQIYEEVNKKLRLGHDRKEILEITSHITEHIQIAIRKVVKAAPDVMEYFQALAKTMTKSFEKPLLWKTPVGFPVFQKYLKTNDKKISTFLGSQRVRMTLKEETEKIDCKKQALGVSPNLIHSLDACALHMTVLKCIENDIKDLALVHDSYGTHAEDIDKLHDLLRKAFMELYKKDIFNILVDNIFQNVTFKEDEENKIKEKDIRPKVGSLNINLVKRSKYFFA